MGRMSQANAAIEHVDRQLAEMEHAAKTAMRWYQDKLDRARAKQEELRIGKRTAWRATLVTAGALVLSLIAHVWRSM